ncbi:MAG: NAD(P)-dependent alcohol dehydrogenase [Myxococcota bacterium]
MPRQWTVRDAFGRSNLHLAEVQEPAAPDASEATIRWSAWSINFRDRLMIDGQYDPRLSFPFIPLSDAAGTVIAAGEASGVSVGDRVVAAFSPSWRDGGPNHDALRKTRGGPIPGLAATHQTLPGQDLVKVPDGLSLAEAATVPCAGVTAYRALVELGGLTAGQRVLVLGSGGVSVWALQLAKALGASVLATTSSEAKAAKLRELGADEVIRYPEDPRWGRTARKWAAPDGIDVVVEVGGAGTLAQSLDAVRPGGTVAVIGVVAGGSSDLSVLPLLMKEIRCQGVFVGSWSTTRSTLDVVGQHGLHPVLDKTFPFEALPDALNHLESGQHIGKIVLTDDA